MQVIQVRNVNNAVNVALPFLIEDGEKEDSRNGVVLVAPGPVMTVYEKPRERVLFGETRDANPFFHLMEALWMLAGRNDVKFPAFFNKRFIDYSDDGEYVHGAYGYRWRTWFGMDQLLTLVDELRENPKSRRAVLSMWSPAGDLCSINYRDDKGAVVESIGGLKSKDVPCNTQAYFDLRHGVLNMTVLNRSNDVIWGAYGANVVHFSIMQEYMAAQLGVEVGVYRQFSNNFHVYTDVYDIPKLMQIAEESGANNYYMAGTLQFGEVPVEPYPLVSVEDITQWHSDLLNFTKAPGSNFPYHDPFFTEVARPMFMAWKARKDKTGNGLEQSSQIIATDWRLACEQWIIRRERKQ